MPERVLHPEFRDEQEFTRYPFADSALLESTGTQQVIEPDTFLDGSLYPIGALGRLYLSAVTVTPREVTLSVADEQRNRTWASATFDPLDPPAILRFTDDWGRPAGILVSEPLRLSRFSAWPTGDHPFEFGQTEFAASCVIPTPEMGVRGVLTEKGELFTGDLWIIGDNGAVVREEDGHIRIDFVGDPLFVRQLCEPVERFTPPVFIKTINGCPPDEYGDFYLTVGDHLNDETILRIYAENDGLVVEAIGQTNTLE